MARRDLMSLIRDYFNNQHHHQEAEREIAGGQIEKLRAVHDKRRLVSELQAGKPIGHKQAQPGRQIEEQLAG